MSEAPFFIGITDRIRNDVSILATQKVNFPPVNTLLLSYYLHNAFHVNIVLDA